jgi:hypothetical protein
MIAEILKELQSQIGMLCGFPVGCSLLNFTAAFVASFLSYPLFVSTAATKEALLSFLYDISNIGKKLKIYFVLWLFLYAVVTGILSAAILAYQYGAASIATAVIYGVLGPFVLRHNLLDRVKTEVVRGANSGVDEIRRIPDVGHNQLLTEIRQDLEGRLKEEPNP